MNVHKASATQEGADGEKTAEFEPATRLDGNKDRPSTDRLLRTVNGNEGVSEVHDDARRAAYKLVSQENSNGSAEGTFDQGKRRRNLGHAIHDAQMCLQSMWFHWLGSAIDDSANDMFAEKLYAFRRHVETIEKLWVEERS